MKKLKIVLVITLITSTVILGQTATFNRKTGIGVDSKSRLINITELNAGFGLGETSADFAKYFIGITSILGYSITKNLQSGIGVGMIYYNGGTLVPLFIDVRYLLNFGKTSVYPFGDGGFLFNAGKSGDVKRMFLNPGIGLRHSFTNNLSGNLGAGLFVQRGSDQSHDSFVNFKLGLTYVFNRKGK